MQQARQLFLFLGLLCLAEAMLGQTTMPHHWKALLANSSKTQSKEALMLERRIVAMSRADRNTYLKELEVLSKSEDPHTSIRAMLIHSNVAPKLRCDSALPLLHDALNRSVLTNDNLLLSDSYFALAEKYSRCGPNERAAFFYLKAWALREKIGLDHYDDNSNLLGRLAETCFRMEEYQQSIRYAKRSLNVWSNATYSGRQFSIINIIGLGFQKLGMYDSAFEWHAKALQKAIVQKDTAWMGIIKGNWGHTLLLSGAYHKALPLLWYDYRIALQYKDEPSAGNTLQRIAQIYLQQQKTDSALLLAAQAQQLIGQSNRYYNPNYSMQAALTLSRIYEAKGDGMAALRQFRLYNHIADSLAQVLKKSRLDVVQTQMDFEQTLIQKNELLKAREFEKKYRVILIAGMALLLVIGWLLYQRKMTANRQAAAQLEQQRQLAEAETRAAKHQLELYTESLYEKNELIEKLRHQLLPVQPQELVEQSILTEDDWLRFRAMFDKVYPDFFGRIIHLASDATPAEQRMAALVRLGIGNKQIASMLGISADTVRKSKSRLRQRLQLLATQDLDQFIAHL